MDTNALQESMQINREPRRKELILEARHSRCIEASNKIRSKLSPRLFMPRAPIYRYTNKLNITLPKIPQRRKVKAQKSITNSKAFNKKSKEDVKGKWDNLKVIGNANSTDNTRYMTDGEIVFIRDKDQGNMEHYSRVENKKTVKTSGTYNFGSSNQVQSKYYDLNCQRTADENQTKDCRHCKSLYDKNSIQTTSINNPDFSNNNSENSLKSSVPRSEYNCQKSNISREQTPKESITTITDLHKENSKESNSEMIPNYLRLQDNAKEYQAVEHYREYIECGTGHNNRQIITKINYKLILKHYSRPRYKPTTETAPILKPSKPITIFKPYLTNPENEQTSSESLTIPNTSSTTLTSSQNNLPSPETTSTLDNSLLQLPLNSYLNRASSAVADFQDTVHAAMSSIYDCSLTDKNIHEDLVNLENSVDSFNKFLLQSYNDMEIMDLKTSNCLEYLNSKNLNRRLQDQHLRNLIF
ncbi:uncharacterized protein LOC119615651 [Lucilia sericata]|uniref:uncharacterized protein LOC119615651 n=1 Tax=Lucilia sericata TaxID=13632 RepID=UPI0018A85D5C|nr:uncharacterized protein LOC119615651 [Lucilia sericata]